jgi:hypothetical protein
VVRHGSAATAAPIVTTVTLTAIVATIVDESLPDEFVIWITSVNSQTAESSRRIIALCLQQVGPQCAAIANKKIRSIRSGCRVWQMERGFQWNSVPVPRRRRFEGPEGQEIALFGGAVQQNQTLARNKGAGGACLLHQLRKRLSCGNAPTGDPTFYITSSLSSAKAILNWYDHAWECQSGVRTEQQLKRIGLLPRAQAPLDAFRRRDLCRRKLAHGSPDKIAEPLGFRGARDERCWPLSFPARVKGPF